MKKALLCLLAAALAPALLQARPAAEDQRIEHLLKAVKELQDAKFVRSGKEYSGADAEAHLRMKLEKAGERVQTAEQFIDGIAAKSYLTGKPYQIRFADGRVSDAGPYLQEKLKSFMPSGAAAKR
ncbi:MAG TPA: DUF5329 family protein [Prosthecobacter sp.]|nr:DUF5329 family protein [Prosthecobacter sp.]